MDIWFYRNQYFMSLIKMLKCWFMSLCIMKRMLPNYLIPKSTLLNTSDIEKPVFIFYQSSKTIHYKKTGILRRAFCSSLCKNRNLMQHSRRLFRRFTELLRRISSSMWFCLKPPWNAFRSSVVITAVKVFTKQPRMAGSHPFFILFPIIIIFVIILHWD